MANCSGITSGSIYDCANPIAPGVDQRLLLLNWADVDVITYDVTNPYIITDITLKSTKAAFAFQGVRQSLQPQYSLQPQTVSIGYDHGPINFSIFDISAAQKENIESMAVVPQIAIIQNLNDVGNGDNYFEVYGVGRGLELITATRIPGDADTAGAFTLELKTPDDTGKESKMPATWYDGVSFASTLTLVENLLTPAA